MEKPVPSADILVQEQGGTQLYIETNTSRHRDWVACAAPQFGHYTELSNVAHTLRVYSSYNVSEVAAYLRHGPYEY